MHPIKRMKVNFFCFALCLGQLCVFQTGFHPSLKLVLVLFSLLDFCYCWWCSGTHNNVRKVLIMTSQFASQRFSFFILFISFLTHVEMKLKSYVFEGKARLGSAFSRCCFFHVSSSSIEPEAKVLPRHRPRVVPEAQPSSLCEVYFAVKTRLKALLYLVFFSSMALFHHAFSGKSRFVKKDTFLMSTDISHQEA